MYKIIVKSDNNYPVDEIDFNISYLRLDHQEKFKQVVKVIEKSINEKTFPNLVIDCRD